MQMDAMITMAPSRIMKVSWLFANFPPKPSLSSIARKTVRTNKVAVARKIAALPLVAVRTLIKTSNTYN